MAKIRITCESKDFLDIDKIESLQGDLKKISKESMDKLKSSIKTYGFSFPVIVWRHNKKYYSIDGVHRCKALKELAAVDGYEIPKQVPVVYIQAKDRKQAKELILAASSQYAALNKDYLINEFMSDLDLDNIQSNIEIPLIDIDALIAQNNPTANDDEIPEEVTPVTKTGDIWELGRHRVLCGDSTKIENVERLMAGEKVDMVFTDPPYGVCLADKNKSLNSVDKHNSKRVIKEIDNDHLKPEQLKEVLVSAFKNIIRNAQDYCGYYVTAPQGGELGMMMMMIDAGIPTRHILIWVKNSANFSIGRLDYDYQHEPILYTWGKKHKFVGGGAQKKSIWNFNKPQKSGVHPTMKPVELIENAILNSSARGGIVGDIFLGSGSTLIACEKSNRICRGIELDPHYCDVIARRYYDWCIANDRKPEIKLNGQPYKMDA